MIAKKIRLVYLPFLVIAVSIIVLYTFLNWLLFIKLNVLSPKEDIINFWLPFIFPCIPVLVWLRPRIKLLRLTGANGNLPFIYQLIAAFAIAVPTIIAQSYIEKASGALTTLEDVSQIGKQEPTKYYALKNYFIDKMNIGVHSSFDVSGKHNENFNMHIYIALPILASDADTNCLAWQGIEYSKQIKNSLEDEEKEKKYEEFADESQKDFDNKDVSQFIYLDRIGNSDDGDGFREAVKKNTKFHSANATVFLAVNEPFEQRIGNRFAWIFGTFAIGGGIWLIMLLFAKLDEEELYSFGIGKSSSVGELKEFIDFLKPNQDYFITPIIIYSNVLIFIIMVFAGLGFISFKGDDLLIWGANYRPSTINGEWWRLLTSTFLHGGLMHLLANMYGLLFVGIFLEPVLGRTKFLTAYLVTGILASCASLWWYDATVSVGASGAIFGLYGLFLALLLTKIFPPDFGKTFLASTLIFIGYNLIMGFTGGIDNAAHIGGLVIGFILGFLFYPTLQKQAEVEI